MNLKNYLNALSLPQREAFARRCKTTVGYLRNVADGSRHASAEVCVRIEVASRLNVMCEEVNPGLPWKYLKERETLRQRLLSQGRGRREEVRTT